jgi:hypothetical protein
LLGEPFPELENQGLRPWTPPCRGLSLPGAFPAGGFPPAGGFAFFLTCGRVRKLGRKIERTGICWVNRPRAGRPRAPPLDPALPGAFPAGGIYQPGVVPSLCVVPI